MSEQFNYRNDRVGERVLPLRTGSKKSADRPVFPTRFHLFCMAAGIFVAVTLLIGYTANDLGLTWDEVPYRFSQRLMAKWFTELSDCRTLDQASPLLTKEAILNGWLYNRYGPNFHPPLAGMLCNLTHAVLGDALGDLPARRMASGIELALAASLLFLFLARRYGLWVSSVAAASLVLTPRVFGDAHIAGTDMPLMAFWGLTALAFWNGLESRLWRVVFGVLLGLSFLVKFSALLMIVPLGIWLLIFRVIPRWSVVRAIAALVGTVFIAWPLGLAGLEIVRLAGAIRLATQQDRMLGSTLDRLAGQMLTAPLGHWPPYTSDELDAGVHILRATATDTADTPIHAQLRRELASTLNLRPDRPSHDAAQMTELVHDARRDTLLKYFQHGPPYTESELDRAATALLREVAALSGESLDERAGHESPFSRRELKRIAAVLDVPALAIDQYIGYVMPKEDLGATTRLPGWLLFLPVPLWLIWSAICRLPFMPAELRGDSGAVGLWFAGLAIAPAVAIALNPTWWHETLPQLAHYYQISVGRQGSLPDIEIFYLGKKYLYSLPWHNGWLLMGVTLPVAILFSAIVGVGTAFWMCRRDPLRIYFVFHMLALPMSRMLPTPAHDGVRLMLPTFFFVAGLAGWGFQWIEQLVERVKSEEYSTAPVLSVAAAFLVGPLMYWLYHTHPHELSYYNGLVAGLPGAQRIGFEPTYWYDAVTPGVIRELNDPDRGLPRGAMLCLPEPQSILEAAMPADGKRAELLRKLPEKRINPEVFEDLWLTRELRQDIRIPGLRGVAPDLVDWPYVALLTHSSKACPFTRLLYAFKPRFAWDFDGVRLFSVYEPRCLARAWALWLLIDATDYSKPLVKPEVDRAMIELARRDYRALLSAALRVSESGLDNAMQSEDDPDARTVIAKLAARRELLDVLLTRRKEALVEAAEILGRTADKRPQLLELLIETYDGYLAAADLGSYLDD